MTSYLFRLIAKALVACARTSHTGEKTKSPLDDSLMPLISSTEEFASCCDYMGKTACLVPTLLQLELL